MNARVVTGPPMRGYLRRERNCLLNEQSKRSIEVPGYPRELVEYQGAGTTTWGSGKNHLLLGPRPRNTLR